MKTKWILCLALSLRMTGYAAEGAQVTPPTAQPKTQVDIKKLSEAFGNFIGRNLKSPEIEFDVNSFISGVKNGSDGKPSPLSEEEYRDGIASLQEEMFSKISKQNLEKAEDYLSKNQKKPGVTSLDDSKLQYEIITQGNGIVVEQGNHPEINYTGKFVDGEMFGSSDETGPITLNLEHTIPGFKKGIVGMKVGEKRRLYIHPDLGYGVTGQLPPNSLLIFDVEILKADNKQEDSLLDDSNLLEDDEAPTTP
jgi:FKBP-type peptidyl-prolyl cis-trans isomerases 1